ncbi:MAG: hypothetical protein KGS72_03255 [Cyanobacteria bacterium REEB67]|nr:hypothetical protein [Cyanobacteria bacterium REEB67]
MKDSDFEFGKLRAISFIRPRKLFTAHASLIKGDIGPLTQTKFAEVREAVVKIIKDGG